MPTPAHSEQPTRQVMIAGREYTLTPLTRDELAKAVDLYHNRHLVDPRAKPSMITILTFRTANLRLLHASISRAMPQLKFEDFQASVPLVSYDAVAASKVLADLSVEAHYGKQERKPETEN